MRPRFKQAWVALFFHLHCCKLVSCNNEWCNLWYSFRCPPPRLSFPPCHPSSPCNEPYPEIGLCSRRMTQPSRRDKKGRYGSSGGSKNSSLSGPFMHRHAVLSLVHEAMTTDSESDHWSFFPSHSYNEACPSQPPFVFACPFVSCIFLCSLFPPSFPSYLS